MNCRLARKKKVFTSGAFLLSVPGSAWCYHQDESQEGDFLSVSWWRFIELQVNRQASAFPISQLAVGAFRFTEWQASRKLSLLELCVRCSSSGRDQ